MVVEWMVLWKGQGVLDRKIHHLHPEGVSLADPFSICTILVDSLPGKWLKRAS
jgi:hypothetical protein